jgi:hypothetical protein
MKADFVKPPALANRSGRSGDEESKIVGHAGAASNVVEKQYQQWKNDAQRFHKREDCFVHFTRIVS